MRKVKLLAWLERMMGRMEMKKKEGKKNCHVPASPSRCADLSVSFGSEGSLAAPVVLRSAMTFSRRSLSRSSVAVRVPDRVYTQRDTRLATRDVYKKNPPA